jgi:hypothetical protein
MEVRSRAAGVPVEFLRWDMMVVDQVLLDLMFVAEPQIALGALVNAHGVRLRLPAPRRG